ncbi:hypothetical protein ACO2Q9_10475 [Variovorax sp. VNK109]|uniref:hypothetical protein n=1 Tax=Variovorax sp. VNK109 TaxID=3400919 RepID=UPI003C073624
MNAPNRTPPRFVPTLTEVVQGQADVAVAPAYGASGQGGPMALSPQMQEALIQRVLQRVDQTLALRLREAISAAALQHSQALAQHMRAEIEAVVTDLVAQAVGNELAGRPPVASAQNPQKN